MEADVFHLCQVWEKKGISMSHWRRCITTYRYFHISLLQPCGQSLRGLRTRGMRKVQSTISSLIVIWIVSEDLWDELRELRERCENSNVDHEDIFAKMQWDSPNLSEQFIHRNAKTQLDADHLDGEGNKILKILHYWYSPWVVSVTIKTRETKLMGRMNTGSCQKFVDSQLDGSIFRRPTTNHLHAAFRSWTVRRCKSSCARLVVLCNSHR